MTAPTRTPRGQCGQPSWSASAVRGAIAEISRTFEAQTGVRVEAEYAPFTVIKRRIDRGETFDIVVLSPELIQNLVTARTIVPETVSLGCHGVGLAARAGQAVPNTRLRAP